MAAPERRLMASWSWQRASALDPRPCRKTSCRRDGARTGAAGRGEGRRDRDWDDRMVEWQVEETKIEKRWGTWMIIDDSYRDYGMRL